MHLDLGIIRHLHWKRKQDKNPEDEHHFFALCSEGTDLVFPYSSGSEQSDSISSYYFCIMN